MSDPSPESKRAASPEGEEISELDEVIGALRLANDVEGLMKLAKQYRAGQGVPRDMKACFAAYAAAAELGSPVAQHAIGLFYLNGGVVGRDEKEAASQFRSAADQGHVASKVLVANFYELGIHYRADAAKADVWYRNAARAAGIEHEPGTPEYAGALADIGAVRHCLEIANLPSTSDADKARLLKLAKTYGYRPEGSDSRPSSISIDAMTPMSRTSAAIVAGLDAGAATPSADEPADRANRPSAKEAPRAKASGDGAKTEKKRAPAKDAVLTKEKVGLGATAFVFTLIFMAVGLVSGHVLDRFAKDKVAGGSPVPVVGMHAELVLPILVGALGLLPNMLVYRRSAFFRALLLATASGIAGNILFGTGRRFVETNVMQTTDFAAAGMLVGLFVFGVFVGGAKPGSR